MSNQIAEAGHHAAEGATKAGHGLKAGLGRKLGPMPVGGWLLAVAGGIGVALYFRNRSAGDATAATTDGTDPTDLAGYDQADPGGTLPGVGGSAGGYTYSDTADDGTADDGTDQAGNPTDGTSTATHHTEVYLARHATSNASWLTHAVKAMSHIGFSATGVQSSLSKYLAAQKLTAGDEVRVSATLARCGNPPNPPKHIAGPGSPHPGGHKPGTGHPGGHKPQPKPTPHHSNPPPTQHKKKKKPPKKKPHKANEHAAAVTHTVNRARSFRL